MKRAISLVLLCGLVVGSLVWSGVASAHGIVVKPGQSIQAAVDAAAPGDAIVVRGGTYQESVVITKDRLRLDGHGARIEPPDPDVASPCADPAHPEETIGICVFGDIFSDPAHPDFTEDVDVEGFRVSGFDAGIVTVGAREAELERNRAVDNHAFGFVSVLSEETRITRNVAARNGTGMLLVAVTGTRVTHNRLLNNGLDIAWDGLGLDNVFRHNRCRTSDPAGLCG